MPLSNSDFVKQVRQEVNFLYESYNYEVQNKDNAFAQWAIQLLFPHMDADQAFNTLVYKEQISGSVAYLRDDNSGIFYIIHTHYSSNVEEQQYGSGVAYALADHMKKILKNHSIYKNKSELVTLDDQLELLEKNDVMNALLDGYSLSGILILFGKKDFLMKEILKNTDLSENEFSCYDLDNLRLLSAGLDEENAVVDRIELEFITEPSLFNGEVEAMIGSVLASEIKRSMEGLEPGIYNTNLRIPLGPNKINRQIMQTLQDPMKSKLFWFYNNGITILCKGFKKKTNSGISFILETPSIVNGAQTTHTILTSGIDATRDSAAAVSVKVIAAMPGSKQVSDDLRVNSSNLQDLQLDIARYTNSQNPIKTPDFRSNEEVQKRLHEEFEELGYFYEHRRGQWTSLNVSEKSRYEKHITMEEVAQSWFAFDGRPAVAIRNKQSLFNEDGYYGSIFMHSRKAREYLLAYKIFYAIYEKLRGKILDAKDAETRLDSNQLNETDKLYLQIGRATKLVASHMTGLIGKALREQNGKPKKDMVERLLISVENGKLMRLVYDELEDTFMRFLDRIPQGQNMHTVLSEESSFETLSKLFDYVLNRERNKGRDPLKVD